jgi:hypothetical protein
MNRNKLICFPGEIMLQQLMEQLLNIKSLESLSKNIPERKKFKMEVRIFFPLSNYELKEMVKLVLRTFEIENKPLR